MVRNVCLGFMLLTIAACASSKTVPDEYSSPLSLWINQVRIDNEEGLRPSLVHSFPQPYLGIEVHDTTMVQRLSQHHTLQILLARGSRPVTSSQETYEVPYRMGFDVTSLLEDAKPGDRLVFTSGEGDQVLCMLPIVQ
uniref:Copper chaperone PCu(A)C n=1 Tax=Roseihalotalea indica TaxID=2867963 RepID=A0AA49GKP8_9BACT|nr:hypothetical protein K4G66_18310 [Tunicatimonas sp. TK19036]